MLCMYGCHSVHAQSDASAATAVGAPPEPNVVMAPEASLFSVDRPDQFPLATATEHPTTSELVVTGTVTPDVSKNVPVVSLASGRVMAIHTRLGDTVQKGQLLMTIRSDDVSGGYSTYKQAVVNEILAKAQLDRGKDLYEHGAIALNDLQVAQDVEDKAKITVDIAAEHLRLLGNDPDKMNFTVDIFAPVSGVITDQEVTVGGF
jgi:membrane fusion protein, heavy metal efflux system